MEPFIGQLMLFAGTFAPQGWAFCDGRLLPIAQNNALFSLLGTTYGGDGQTTFGLPDLRGRVPIGMGQAPGLSNIIQGEKLGTQTVTLTIPNMPAHSHAVTLAGAQASINTTVKGTIAGAGASGYFPAKTVPTTGEVAIPVNTDGGFSLDTTDPTKGVLGNPPNAIYSSTSTPNAKYSGKAIAVTNGETKIPQTLLNLPVTGSVYIPIQTTAAITGTATAAPAGSNSPVSIMQPYLGMNYCIALQGIYPSRE